MEASEVLPDDITLAERYLPLTRGGTAIAAELIAPAWGV